MITSITRCFEASKLTFYVWLLSSTRIIQIVLFNVNQQSYYLLWSLYILFLKHAVCSDWVLTQPVNEHSTAVTKKSWFLTSLLKNVCWTRIFCVCLNMLDINFWCQLLSMLKSRCFFSVIVTRMTILTDHQHQQRVIILKSSY